MSIELAGITAEHLAVAGVVVLTAWRSYLASKRPTWERGLAARALRLHRGPRGEGGQPDSE